MGICPARLVSRRAFLLISALLACGVGVHQSSASVSKPGFTGEWQPSVIELLAMKPSTLVDELKTLGFSYNDTSRRFESGTVSFFGYEGNAKLTVLGDQTKNDGRRMSPGRLQQGEPVRAVQFTVFFTEDHDRIVDEVARALFDKCYRAMRIESDDVFGEMIAPASGDIPPLSYAGARCEVESKETVFAITVLDPLGITLSCSYLDYYVCCTSFALSDGDDFDDASYESILNNPPWDIFIDDRLVGLDGPTSP